MKIGTKLHQAKYLCRVSIENTLCFCHKSSGGNTYPTEKPIFQGQFHPLS